MKKYISIIALLSLSIPEICHSQSDASPVSAIQLKVMQTRKFLKPPLEVMLAAKTFCEDNGSTNAVGVRPKLEQDGSPTPGTGVLTCLYGAKISFSFFGGIKNSVKVSQIKFQALGFSKDEITLRARIYSGYPNVEQSTNPEEYSKLFKSIADTVFTEALNLEATSQD